MSFFRALVIAGLSLAASCTPQPDGRSTCTAKAITAHPSVIEVTLLVPAQQATDTANILAFSDGCDFPLNSIFSDETKKSIREEMPEQTLTDNYKSYHVIDAELFFYKFSNNRMNPGFFVTGIKGVRAVRNPRTLFEAKYFSESKSGR